MLVLSRQVDEAIVITASNGERIVIEVTRINRGLNGAKPSVGLGFAADRSVQIDRAEVHAKREEKK